MLSARALCLSAVLVGSSAMGAGVAPPESEAKPVTDVVHGVEITDAYRWLEGDNSDAAKMGTLTEEVVAWTDAQNAYTRGVLDALPGREKLEARLRELMEVGSIGSPTMAGERYFYMERRGSQAQSVLYVRDGHGGEPRVLVDPNTLDESGLLTLSWYAPTDDGETVALGMYSAGDENATLYLLDVDTGTWLADEIPGKVNFGGWLPGGDRFVYRRLESLDNPYSGQVKIHEVGTHHRMDETLLSQSAFVETVYGGDKRYTADDLRKLSATYGPYAYLSHDGRWMLLAYYTGTGSNDLWALDLGAYDRSGELDLVPVLEGTYFNGAAGSGGVVGDTLYLQTTLEAPSGRVVAVDLLDPGADGWREIVPAREGVVIGSASLARGMLAVTSLENATSRIDLYGLDGSSKGSVELPGIGTASLGTDQDRTEAFISFSSYNEPRSIYRVNLASGERELWARPEVPVDPSTVDVKQVWYESKDGTRVSMFVIHKKGLTLDGNNPTILYGYGGFTVSLTPRFSATMFPWFEAGGVYAIPNLRGGGEYGEDWHQAGMLDRKQNVFDDFIAAGEWLIENGYTKPERLGIAGGSNGGLLTGAALTQRPDLFAAAISAVPLLDMIRYDKFLMGRYWIPEYGTADDAAQFEYLLEYSPYQNVKPGTKYPAVLLTAGENDSRVHPLHARKMAALLQASTGADQDEDPILLWVDRDAGHGQGKPLHLRVRDVADQRIFMMWQLGMLDGTK